MVFNAAAATQEEEYVLVADYVTDTEGELSVSAGDVVQLINREATGIIIIIIIIIIKLAYHNNIILWLDENIFFRMVVSQLQSEGGRTRESRTCSGRLSQAL